MKKNNSKSITKGIFAFIICISLILGSGICAWANTSDVTDTNGTEQGFEQWDNVTDADHTTVENNDTSTNGDTLTDNDDANDKDSENVTTEDANGKENADTSAQNPNIFDEIYTEVNKNSHKIFSALAFLGTLVVGILYKSNLIPLLRDALSRLKGSIDSVQEENHKCNQENSDKMQQILSEIEETKSALEENRQQISRIKWQFDGYQELMNERFAMKTLVEGQIDLLYAIFMSSDLPQYQKDEIGEKIQAMREELCSYEMQEK